jgi:hypothetical protein
MRRSLGIVILFITAVGCDRESPAQAEKKASPAAKAEGVEGIDASKPPQKVDPEKIEKAEPTEPTEKTEPAATNPAKATLTAGIEAPSKTDLLALAKPAIPGDLALLAPMVEFGPRRFAAALRSQPDKTKPVFEVHAVIVEASEASPPVWSVIASLEIHEVDGSKFDETVEAEPSSIPTTVLADDYDDDGEPELLVRVRNHVMCEADGDNEITTLAIVDPAPAVGIALKTELHHTHRMDIFSTKATVSHEDLNGDGHRDVRIKYETTTTPLDDDADPSTEVAENRWLWEAGRDAWTLQNEASGKPAYSSWGCGY